MQESINQQKASIDNLQTTFEEEIHCLKDQISTFIQSFGEPCEGQSMRQSAKKDFKRAPSLTSLNTSLNASLSTSLNQ